MEIKNEKQRSHKPDQLISRNLRAIREDLMSSAGHASHPKAYLNQIVLELDMLSKVESEADTTEYLNYLAAVMRKIEGLLYHPLYMQYYEQLQATSLVGLEFLAIQIENEIKELEKAISPDITVDPNQLYMEEAYVQTLKTLYKLAVSATEGNAATMLCQLQENWVQTQRKFIESVKLGSLNDSQKTSKETPQQTVNRLISQIGDYPKPTHVHGVADLSNAGKVHLYTGIAAYKKSHSKLPHNYHREQFIKYVTQLANDNTTNFKGCTKMRKNTPENATTTMEALLGKEGLKLYQLALQEEAYSEEYRDAVFNASTKFIEGNKWDGAKFIIIPGPSASGKSHATDAVIRKIDELPQKTDDHSGNVMVCVDGGIPREISQMRKLAVRLANKKGFSGISDLHEQSKILEDIKTHVKNAALASPNLSIVMPETYSTWMVPFSGHEKFIDDISKSERQFIVATVVGKNAGNFREVVRHMGTRRAYKTDNFDQVELDLNSTEGLTESKAYGPSGFDFGVYGSNKAVAAYVEIQTKNRKPILKLEVENDLILLREESENLGSWVPAKPGDEGILMVSQHIYVQWYRQSAQQKANMDLRAYAKANPYTKINPSQDFETLLNAGAAPVPSPMPVAAPAGAVSFFGVTSVSKPPETTNDVKTLGAGVL
ncbi:hypothetical protein LEAN103870_00640 [Legionella anisa]|uniref:UDP-N-acetylglucosamine kinase n=1 Tax=Legionella anisa TaxID=28082 RepID=A0AAX0WUT9_9GAMM|nr:hypothetical protein [Legionella anisa]AWN73907.1 hypothetical protein DLD14_08710 [Legionella anisa]KTC67176.1 hypothetical protein Lani_3521 [Legionella anisa]MBN5937095.1 hypothetical protein [Legionella anisa]MCW8426172.1 hypothetical protein [Legionella anisa]MCW8448483.1 hypothetical protein [Legionella anisa]